MSEAAGSGDPSVPGLDPRIQRRRLDERYGRTEPVAGFVGRSAVGGVAAALLGTAVYGAVTGLAWPDPGALAILLLGLPVVLPGGGLAGTIAALVGLAAERAGRSSGGRRARLAVGGGLAVVVLLEALLLLGGPVAATYPPAVAAVLIAAAVGALLLVRLRHRTWRQALRIPRRRAAARA